jgi:hypothetical protein
VGGELGLLGYHVDFLRALALPALEEHMSGNWDGQVLPLEWMFYFTAKTLHSAERMLS